MNKKKLFEDDENENSEIKLNQDYVSKYEQWRRKEELNKCKARYGDLENVEDETSSSDDNDDDLNEAGFLDAHFLQTLSCLKNEDPRIYDKNVNFFSNIETVGSKKMKEDKPMFLRDYERKILLETGGQVENSDEDEVIKRETIRSSSPTYVEEQKQLKENLKEALEINEGGEEEDDWGGMFKKKKKSKDELLKEEEDYIQWLKGQRNSLSDSNIENELKPLKNYWGNPELDDGEKFLRDYILNKKFLDHEDSNHIPSYDEIVHDSDDGLSEDGEAIRIQEEFETKYNYRFEEPDKEFIKRYPRILENSVRKTDDRRKIKRAEIRERKEQEKLRKKEELQQIKAIKRKEIEEKIKMLQEITGNEDVGFKDDDFENDFDPDEHDKRMQELFNDEFYNKEEGDQKPEFPNIDEELDIENWDKWKGPQEDTEVENYNKNKAEPHCEDEDFNMDCDYDPSNYHQQEMIENSKNKRKRRRKSKFAKVISEKKPIFDPKLNKTYEEYLNEYYKLDYEDIIGDIPCRFKYRKVVPNDFGLSIDEILAAKDKELNKWCSLKKAIQIRPDHVEKYDVLAYKKKSENKNLKKKIFLSLYSSDEKEIDIENRNNDQMSQASKTEIINENKKAKKKKNKIIIDVNQIEENNTTDNASERNNLTERQNNSNKKKNKKRKLIETETEKSDVTPPNKKRKQNSNKQKKLFKNKKSNNKIINTDLDIGLTNERLKAYGLNPKKFKNKLKFKK